jgi:hypothetical protein
LAVAQRRRLALGFRGDRQGSPVFGVLNHDGAVLVPITAFINTKRSAVLHRFNFAKV